MEELVSVIVPSYKNFQGMEKTLESILSQDYKNIEIIISDDGSPNFKEAYPQINSYLEEHKRVNIKNIIINALQKNVGTVKNINSAIKLANGKYVKILPFGDEFYSDDVLSKCVTAMEGSSSFILIGRTFCKDRHGNNTGKYKDSISYRYKARSGRKSIIFPTSADIKKMQSLNIKKRNEVLKSRCIISTVSVFFPMEILKRTGGFLEDYRLLEDMPYWPYLAEKGIEFRFEDLIMVLYSLGGISNSGAANKAFYSEYIRVMNEIYIKNDNRFGIFKNLNKHLRKKEIKWGEVKLENGGVITRLKYIDIIILQLIKSVKYLLFNRKL